MTSPAPTLRSLGDPALVRWQDDGSETLIFDLGKPLALITYLACAPARTATREHLVDLLWADLDREAGRKGLRQALWRIRDGLGDDFLTAERDTVTLTAEMFFDRDELLAAANRGDLERVNALYHGDFFSSFATPGSGEFERWADLERARLRSVFTRSVERLTRRRLQEGRSREAVELARRVRDADRLQQQGWRLLLEALIAASDSLLAVVEADGFEHFLSSEDLEPDQASRELLRLARRTPPDVDSSAFTVQAALVAELAGREREFAAILAAWDIARTGHAVPLRVTAPAGLGKTRLVTEVQARLRSMRAHSIYVRANPGARDVPYALAADLAYALGRLPGAIAISPSTARELVALDPRLGHCFSASAALPVTGRHDILRHRLQALRELVAVIADEQPVAILIDDVHWADLPSRQLISGLLGALRREAVLVIVTERSPGQSLVFPQDARTVPLVPLSLSAVTALIASVAALPAEPWAERLPAALLAASGGSPLLALETLQLAVERGLLTRVESRWCVGDASGLFASLKAGGALGRRIEQLSADQRAALLTLACAGTSMEGPALARALASPTDMMTAALEPLERLGMVARVGGSWIVAHDEIASATLDRSDDSEQRRCHAAIGGALLAGADSDLQRLRFAAQHMRAASDVDGLYETFTRFLRAGRRRGDRRHLSTVARELVGDRAEAAEIKSLTRNLPFRLRAGLDTAARLALAITAALLVPLGVAATVSAIRHPTPPPDAVLAVATTDRRGISIYEARIDSATWIPGTPIVVNTRGRPRWQFAGLGLSELAARPGHPGQFVAVEAMADSGDAELVLLGPDGRTRLTYAPGDDVNPAWSPDGAKLVFATGRWNELQHWDLAILDLATRQVSPITHGDATDAEPAWSPDGTRIAFGRRHWDEQAPELCLTSASGDRLRCQGVANALAVPVLGWVNAHSVLTGGRAAGIEIVDVETWESRMVLPQCGRSSTSRDGRWTASQCRSTDSTAWSLSRRLGMGDSRRIVVDSGSMYGEPMIVDWTSRQTSLYIDRLSVAPVPGSPRVGIPHRVPVTGLDRSGGVQELHELTFRSSDTALATIDSSGTLHPMRAGELVVSVTAGGWRSIEQRLVVVPNTVDTLTRENWTTGIGSVWRVFGDPSPSVETGPGGTPGMNNRGDGKYVSGVHSARSFDLQQGLALEAMVSTPITLPQWQTVYLSLQTEMDTVGLAAWDHRAGYPWTGIRGFDVGACPLLFPGGDEGPRSSEWLRGPSGADLIAAPAELKLGGWHRVRLQIFPDGRCGIALDGTPIFLGAQFIRRSTGVVFLYGNSFRTSMLVGPLTVLSGVPTDVDWERPVARPAGAMAGRSGTPHGDVSSWVRRPHER